MWKTSRVLLPKSLGAQIYRDVFTGAEVQPVVASEVAWIFVGQALQTLPVALLVAGASPQDDQRKLRNRAS
jgi:hypothetical protein